MDQHEIFMNALRHVAELRARGTRRKEPIWFRAASSAP
jgi:hypothetical protein